MYWREKLGEKYEKISYLDSKWLEKLNLIEEFINRLSSNWDTFQLKEIQERFNTVKFENFYKKLKATYMEKGENFYEVLEYWSLSKKEKEQYCEYLLKKYNKIKNYHNGTRILRADNFENDEKRIKEFYNNMLKKLNILENLKITARERSDKELTKFPTNFLEDKELLIKLVELDLNILLYRNDFLLEKKMFYIIEFRPSDKERRLQNKKEAVQYKIYKYFLNNGILSTEKYDIFEIGNILAQFDIHEFEILSRTLLSSEKERIYDLYKVHRNRKYEKVNNKKRECNILKIILSFSKYPDLKNTLNELGIWNKYCKTTKEGNYEIYINLADINVPYNKERVEELQEEQKNNTSYIEAEKECRIEQIEQVELEAKMLLKDEKQGEILEQMSDLKNKIQNRTRAFEEDEKNEITNLLNKCEDTIKLKIEENFEGEKKETRDVEVYFCKQIINKNLKQLQSLTCLKEKIEMINKMAKAHEILGEVLGPKSFIEDVFWEEKFELLKIEAIKSFLLGKDENIFLKFLNKSEINRVNCEFQEALPYFGLYKNYIVKDYKNFLLQCTNKKENWRFEYLQLPIYKLEDFDFNGEAKKVIEEKYHSVSWLKYYSILEVHQLVSKLGILEGLQMSNNQMKDFPQNLIYDIYEDELFNKEIAAYFGQEEIKQSDKIKRNNESMLFSVTEYAKYSKKEDYYL